MKDYAADLKAELARTEATLKDMYRTLAQYERVRFVDSAEHLLERIKDEERAVIWLKRAIKEHQMHLTQNEVVG